MIDQIRIWPDVPHLISAQDVQTPQPLEPQTKSKV